MPERVQLHRTKGWRKPEGAIVVARPTQWGNPFIAGQHTHLWHRSAAYPYDFYRDWFAVLDAANAVRLYRRVLTDPEFWLDQPLAGERGVGLSQLRGRDLACWCPIEDASGNRAPCHADVLLELANGGGTR